MRASAQPRFDADTIAEVTVTRCLVTRREVELMLASGGAPAAGMALVGRDDAGRRVVVTPVIRCGSCDMCRSGLADHCRAREVIGVDRDGGLADTIRVPAANLIEVPDAIDDDRAVFAAPLAAAIHAARQITIANRPYVTVLGDELLGLLVVQVMGAVNASVRLIGTTPTRLALCERWGAKHRMASDVGRRADQDIVVDVTGATDGLDLALSLVRPRGTVLRAGPHRIDDPPIPVRLLDTLTMQGISLIGSFGHPMTEAVHHLLRDEVDVISLLSRAAGDATTALRLAADPEAVCVVLRR